MVVDNDNTTSLQIAVTISIPVIHDFYTRLCRRGKDKKVALVAAMRKLLLILTAVVWDQVPWQPNRVLEGRQDGDADSLRRPCTRTHGGYPRLATGVR